MKPFKILLLSILFVTNIVARPNNFQNDVLLKLGNGFFVKFSEVEDYKTFKVYNRIELIHNGVKVFSDNKLEYEAIEKIKPVEINATTFEILLEVNDRPNKNYIKLLRIKDNKIISQSKLPTFIAKPSNLDNDSFLEYAGFWDFGEVWGDKNELTSYNPIIYYKLTKNGIKLDSTLTIKKNTEIYGKFKGFKYDSENPVSAKSTANFEKEINRIKNNVAK